MSDDKSKVTAKASTSFQACIPTTASEGCLGFKASLELGLRVNKKRIYSIPLSFNWSSAEGKGIGTQPGYKHTRLVIDLGLNKETFKGGVFGKRMTSGNFIGFGLSNISNDSQNVAGKDLPKSNVDFLGPDISMKMKASLVGHTFKNNTYIELAAGFEYGILNFLGDPLSRRLRLAVMISLIGGFQSPSDKKHDPLSSPVWQDYTHLTVSTILGTMRRIANATLLNSKLITDELEKRGFQISGSSGGRHWDVAALTSATFVINGISGNSNLEFAMRGAPIMPMLAEVISGAILAGLSATESSDSGIGGGVANIINAGVILGYMFSGLTDPDKLKAMSKDELKNKLLIAEGVRFGINAALAAIGVFANVSWLSSAGMQGSANLATDGLLSTPPILSTKGIKKRQSIKWIPASYFWGGDKFSGVRGGISIEQRFKGSPWGFGLTLLSPHFTLWNLASHTAAAVDPKSTAKPTNEELPTSIISTANYCPVNGAFKFCLGAGVSQHLTGTTRGGVNANAHISYTIGRRFSLNLNIMGKVLFGDETKGAVEFVPSAGIEW
ncbi:MAG: hypothetical protein ABIE74_07005 [Pseudomonadota bacterium]